MYLTTNHASLLAAIVALAALAMPLPASAGGNVTLAVTPNGKSAKTLHQGLQIYSMVKQYKHAKNHAKISQRGKNNAAGLAQKETGNHGLIVQRGRDHSATVGQYSYNNALGVVQFGKKTNLDVAQIGNGHTGLILQGGW